MRTVGVVEYSEYDDNVNDGHFCINHDEDGDNDECGDNDDLKTKPLVNIHLA